MREAGLGTTDEPRYDENGLVCVVAQDRASGDVLMVCLLYTSPSPRDS